MRPDSPSYLGQLRTAAGLDLPSVEVRLGMTEGRLREIEAHKVDPWFEEMRSLSALYNVSLSELAANWSAEGMTEKSRDAAPAFGRAPEDEE